MLPIIPKLTTRDVHLWYTFLDQRITNYPQYLTQLSSDEQKRAAHFRADRAQHGFVISRVFLRSVLAQYLNVEPEMICFRYGPHGKPALEAHSPLRFNLSHTTGMALLAITNNREIGVDIESIRSLSQADDIVVHYFAPGEIAVFNVLPEQEKSEAFFRCWTRKEAYIKARGDGLAMPLDSFDVSLARGEPARLLRVENELAELERWTLSDLNIAEDYAAALCVEGNDWNLTTWEWKG